MKKILAVLMAAVMLLTLTACSPEQPSDEGKVNPEDYLKNVPAVEDLTGVDTSAIIGVEDGVLTVGMECAYAPYNWTQMDDSNGAVPIKGMEGTYANGYDVQIAKMIAEANGWGIEIMALEWGGLTPALEAGIIDVAIAGQSMTADRMAEVDMAGPYYYATIVCVTTADSLLASATSIADLSGK